MSPQAEAVTARLHSTWEKWWTFSLLTGLVFVAAGSCAALVGCVLADALWRLPQRTLAVLLVGWAGATAAGLGLLFARLLRFRRSLAATARRVEMAFPELGSHLINLVQLGDPSGSPGDDYRLAAAEQAAEAVGEVAFDQAAAREGRWGRFTLCMQGPRDLVEALGVLAAVLALGGLLHMALPSWPSATRRLLHPWQFVPASGALEIVEVAPGNTELLLGSSLDVTARVAGRARREAKATLFVRPKGGRGPETGVPMRRDRDGGTFTATVVQVAHALEYRLEIGDSQSERYRVGVYQKPAVAEVEVTYTLPAYLKRPPQVLRQKTGDLEAPQFTTAELAIHPTVPVAQGFVEIGGRKLYGKVEDRGKTVRVELLLRDPTTYTIYLATAAGHTDDQPRTNQIKVLPDAAPTALVVQPGKDAGGVAGSQVDVVVQAADDYGLGEVRIEARSGTEGTQEPAVATVASWSRFAGDGTAAQLHHELALDPAKYPAGQALAVRVVARDRRAVDRPDLKLGPQEAASPWVPIRVLDPSAKATTDLARIEDLRSAVTRILQQQVQARLVAVGVPKQPDRDAARKAAEGARQQQVEVQKASVAVLEKAAAAPEGGGDEDERTLRQALHKLAYGDMLEAVRQAEALGQVENLAGMAEPAGALGGTQDRIIDVLRRLLNELRRETADLLAELKKRPDTALPPDVQDKLRALRDRLEEFLKQQKKVIEATENLAKKPVDDFTEDEKKALEALAATEDDWSKFLADQHSDLSKLPEQDFSNPSLLQEIIAVENEIKMAKDALTKKTADIAVPLEQLGAEMAKELTTNIEKWLPDTPDRERWSQEEPLTDEMKEAPMAELPQELEDIVGELMEEEEDVFDEMEDITSSWADSLDKGAGWDALDGPISNMSARGVTGNRLPNTSEIGGRSGEGRSGKSSGEFVGDTAVGKGGRKTPTRLTPDAFVKGEVKDTSKDPVGGATGGGKTSGYGGEGLQGPVPDRAQNPLVRLANRQAALRNKAEGVDLKFQVLRYHHTDLKTLIGQMAAVEQDLRAGLYQNALRRRDVVLEGLGQVRTYLSGEFVIQQDRSANLPTEIQKEILGSMQEASPAGWDELNRRYFERLGQAALPAKAAAGAPAPPPSAKPE